MTRLPVPGSDKNTWGDVLNGFLNVAHNADGTLNQTAIKAAGAVTTVNGAASDGQGNVTLTIDNANTIKGATIVGGAADGQVLQFSGTSGTWVPTTITSSGSVQNATTSAPGVIQLAGGLSGIATSPTVSKVQGVSVSATAPTGAGQVLTATGTGTAAWQTPAAQTVVDASSSAKGIIQLAGDLGGSAASPTVPGLVNKLDATTASNTYAPKASPTFSGTVTLPSAAPTAATQAATKGYVDTQIAGVSGGTGAKFTATTANANVTATNMAFVLGNASTAGFTVTLPAVANGAWVRVKKLDATSNAILVAGASGTIDGSATFSVNIQYMSQDFMSDGTNWFLI